MKRTIELKHVGPREHVQRLINDLIDRLEEKLRHFPREATSVHVLFDENGTHKIFRTSLACHVPGHMVAAREESRDAGATIRRAFAEIERQLERHKTLMRHDRLRRRTARGEQRQRATDVSLTKGSREEGELG